MPNLLLMLCFPLLCLGFGVAMDVALIVVGRRKVANFPGGANRLYWAVMISALIRSAVFSLIMGLVMQLLPFALVVVIAYVGYLAVTGRLRRS